MAMGSDFFWKLFEASGHVDAYLLYTDFRKLQQAEGRLEYDRLDPAGLESLDRDGLQAAGGDNRP